VSAFAEVWYGKKRDHTAIRPSAMNAVLDAGCRAFRIGRGRAEEFRGQLTAYRNLYAFLSQIIPYQDSELEQFYTFCRNLIFEAPAAGRWPVLRLG
jgi:type I restriction enzyme R subunit